MVKVTTKNGVVRFRTTLLQGGKTATGIQVPEAAVTALGSHKRPPVKVTINGGHILSIEGAKTPETRQRRIDKALDALREGRTP